ncbi:MAG: radical SAM protein, partial [Syntrophomonadaceae bacterium]|nr:radical SAM protein [Syntrophomonadaceae bacterium]
MKTAASGIIKKYQFTGTLSREELKALLSSEDGGVFEGLRREADRVRREWVGDAVHLRGIIEFSNFCRRSCAYCGINRHNRGLPRYRLTPEEVVETARRAAKLGFKTVVLQSGEDPFYTTELLAEVVREIKKAEVAVTLSVGERPPEDYRAWREAGADRYLLKFETSDPRLYARLHPGCSLDQRLRCLHSLKELGYQAGSGNIVGLPGQSVDTL